MVEDEVLWAKASNIAGHGEDKSEGGGEVMAIMTFLILFSLLIAYFLSPSVKSCRLTSTTSTVQVLQDPLQAGHSTYQSWNVLLYVVWVKAQELTSFVVKVNECIYLELHVYINSCSLCVINGRFSADYAGRPRQILYRGCHEALGVTQVSSLQILYVP